MPKPNPNTNDVTNQWIDLYTAVLESLAQALGDPEAMYKRLGVGKNEEGRANFNKMSMEEYRILMASWRRVSASIRMFGLELGDDLMIAPDMRTMSAFMWKKNPWLELSRRIDFKSPLNFKGRDAMTALGFVNFYAQKSDSVDPGKHVRNVLAAQGINAENFHLHADRLAIKNPFV